MDRVKKWTGRHKASTRLVIQRFLINPKRKLAMAKTRKTKNKCLGNTDRTGGNAAKAKQGGNQGDDKKYKGVVQHGVLVNKPGAWETSI